MFSEQIKILLVEDNLGDARLIEEMLKDNSVWVFKTTHVKSLHEAHSYLQSETCDLILLDLGLPDSQGLDTLRKFEGIQVPIVVLTGLNDEAVGFAAISTEGAMDYLIKDEITPSSLARAIRYAVQRYTSEATIHQLNHKNKLILSSVGEGIIGIDRHGKHLFINVAAETFLGYRPGELDAYADHSTWHHTRADGTPYPEEECPIIKTYHEGIPFHSDQEVFWRKDGTAIAVEYISTPIYENEMLVGAVVVFNDITKRKESEQKIKSMYNVMRTMLYDTVYSLSMLAELRDPYTAGHQHRVSQLSVAIAEEIGLSKDTIESIHIAAAMHDIGKTNIPAEILTKPGKLTSLEYQFIMTHPQTGFDVLEKIQFPWQIAKIILQHHERLDGSGYPQGLKGEEIMLEAMIIAVADTVDAMATHRPYRAALGIEIALNEIEHLKGTLYDETVVETCIRVFKEKKFKFTDSFKAFE
jgi:PAS domain S-box-containing protein/putative nucleotidyltransferase with HDIG domain